LTKNRAAHKNFAQPLGKSVNSKSKRSTAILDCFQFKFPKKEIVTAYAD